MFLSLPTLQQEAEEIHNSGVMAAVGLEDGVGSSNAGGSLQNDEELAEHDRPFLMQRI